MTGTPSPAASAAGYVDGLSGRSGYRVSYGANYRVEFCSQNGPRPRQHWVFAQSSSPTTRPPRREFGGEGAGSRARDLRSGGAGGGGATQAKQHLGEVNRREGKRKTEKRQLHAQADRAMKTWKDRQGGRDRVLGRLAFGQLEVVR
jgi:hypothetical protein